MATEASIDDELLLIVGFCELEEQNFGGEVVDVGDPESTQALLELVGNDLRNC